MFQERMSWLVEGIENVMVCIDDLLIISEGSFEEHMNKLDLVLQRLQKGGLKVKPQICKWAMTEVEYLGHWITQKGVKPMANKVESILGIQQPRTRKEIRRFMGMINFYRDMWEKRSELLAPLAALTSKTRWWKLTDICTKAFEGIKSIIARDVMLSYPNFSKEFIIHTDASDVQLGGVITQDNKPLAFFSRKLLDAQKSYTVTERELLSIVEILKEYRNMLLGQKIIVYTDHLICSLFA